MIDREILKAELANPEYTQALQRGDHVTVAQAFNMPRYDIPGLADPVDIFIRVATLGFVSRLHDAISNTSLSHPARSAASALYTLLHVFPHRDISWQNARIFDMIDTVVAGGVLTEAEGQAFKQATNGQMSRAELLFGRGTVVTPDVIGEVLWEEAKRQGREEEDRP